jgi:hypothetical protein
MTHRHVIKPDGINFGVFSLQNLSKLGLRFSPENKKSNVFLQDDGKY